MDTLVVSDIHQKHEKAQRIIDNVPHDRVVFLGDYFDDYNDTPQNSYDTAVWVKQRMEEHPEDEFLIGNHDVPYLFGPVQCSGFSVQKKAAIKHAVGDLQKFRSRMKLAVWVDGWLLTHAGLCNGLHPAADVNRLLSKEIAACMAQLEANNPHYLVEAGADRGGWRRHGGITWVDYRKFQPIPGVKQLFGHTLGLQPRNNGDNWCIDTKLDHYALIKDGELSVHEAAE